MKELELIQNDVEMILIHQLKQHWIDIDESIIHDAIPNTLKKISVSFQNLNDSRFYCNGEVRFSPYNSLHWSIFLYRLSNELYRTSSGIIPKEADMVYYLNKIFNSVDWFYAIELPPHFLCEHPLGSVLGRAKYGDYFFVYQGTTVGGNRNNGKLCYPVIGKNVIMFANSTILGESIIGENVVISAETYIINEVIPDNSIVFGKSPNLIIKNKSPEMIKKYTEHIWRW
ncbi:MAG: transferase [Lachnospiraceae bacterium]|nr:transferase [Lachnospiraceae bacterium]